MNNDTGGGGAWGTQTIGCALAAGWHAVNDPDATPGELAAARKALGVAAIVFGLNPDAVLPLPDVPRLPPR